MAPANEKQHAHELIDRMPIAQVSAIVQMIEAMLDPVSRTIANAPIDDEPESDTERQAVAASKEWLEKHPGEGVSLEDLSADLGISVDDLKR
jgi:transcriptional regulator GlxA family with amidase domain